MKTISDLFSFGIVAMAFSANAQTQTFTLEDAKAYALEHHLNIIEAQGNIDIAQQQIVETRGMGLPQVNITGQFNQFINLPVTVVDASFLNPAAPAGETVEFQMGTEFNANGTLQATQLIFNGSYIIGLKATKHVRSFQEQSYLVTKEDVVFNVIQAYHLASIAQENQNFMDSLVDITERLKAKQQHYFDLGLIVQEEMDQLEFAVQTAKNAKVMAEVQLVNAMNILKFSMGLPLDAEISVSDKPDALLGKRAISMGDIHNNLQYGLLERSVILAEMNLKNNQFANLPTLNAYFTQAYNAYRTEFNFFADERWFPQTLWGLQLNIPVFSGLQRHARTQQARIEKMQSETRLQQLERALQMQEIQLRNNLAGAQSRYSLQEANVNLAQTIYRNALEVEKIGKGNSLIVTQKHNQLIQAQAQYLASLMDLLQTQLDLDKLYNEILKNQ
jgi:outer membrane protein TolC